MNNKPDNDVITHQQKPRNCNVCEYERLRGAKILIAEDFESSRHLLKAILLHFAMDVDAVENGRQVLELIDRKLIEHPHCRYDAILMDINMPILDGIETARCLRSQECHASLPIIGLSAAIIEYGCKDWLTYGMNDFVGKPIDIDELLTVLAKWINR